MDEESGRAKRIRFHYIKSPLFHTVHADGAIGGITPRGGMHIAFYAERLPIPQQVEHSLTEVGGLGEEHSRIGREGVVRELSVDVVMDLGCARALRDWLSERLDAPRGTSNEGEE